MLKIVEKKQGGSRESSEGQSEFVGEPGPAPFGEDADGTSERVFPGLVFRIRPQDSHRS